MVSPVSDLLAIFILQSIIISSIIFDFYAFLKYFNPQRTVNILLTVPEKLYWLSSTTCGS